MVKVCMNKIVPKVHKTRKIQTFKRIWGGVTLYTLYSLFLCTTNTSEEPEKLQTKFL